MEPSSPRRPAMPDFRKLATPRHRTIGVYSSIRAISQQMVGAGARLPRDWSTARSRTSAHGKICALRSAGVRVDEFFKPLFEASSDGCHIRAAPRRRRRGAGGR